MKNTARTGDRALYDDDRKPELPDAPKIRTIADLAELAGVTPGTVSRALSGKGLIAENTRKRIRALASEHNFQPNVLARNLRTRRTGLVNVVIPLGHDAAQHLSDPFFMTMLAALADELTGRDLEMLLTRIIPQDDGWLERLIDTGRSDGVILIGQSDQAPAIDRAAKRFLPLVAWGARYKGQSHCSIGSDNLLGGRLAMERLLASGSRRIVFFGDPRPIETARRLEGAQIAAREAGLSDALAVAPIHYAHEKSATEIEQFLNGFEQTPDGIFAASDLIAANILFALARRGLNAPRDVRIVGFDDLPIASLVSPRLTTIRQDFAQGAAHIVNRLMRRIGGEAAGSIEMAPELVIRETA